MYLGQPFHLFEEQEEDVPRDGWLSEEHRQEVIKRSYLVSFTKCWGYVLYHEDRIKGHRGIKRYLSPSPTCFGYMTDAEYVERMVKQLSSLGKKLDWAMRFVEASVDWKERPDMLNRWLDSSRRLLRDVELDYGPISESSLEAYDSLRERTRASLPGLIVNPMSDHAYEAAPTDKPREVSLLTTAFTPEYLVDEEDEELQIEETLEVVNLNARTMRGELSKTPEKHKATRRAGARRSKQRHKAREQEAVNKLMELTAEEGNGSGNLVGLENAEKRLVNALVRKNPLSRPPTDAADG